ncbi:MAG: TIGR01459 family HAD-type hydrolase [Alphaproteobacteria bacterium]|nr:TIGR01459 family HAD-type hydrolase [Alphaproteobacteria bacterium]
MTDAIPILDGIGGVASRYRAAILDLWGVIHNGIAAYPAAVDCLARFRAAGIRTVLLSNAPRRSQEVVRRLEELGVVRAAYDAIVTSGDLTRAALERRDDPFHAGLGERYFRLGPERDWGLMEGLDYEVVPDLARATFVAATGLFDDDRETVADYDAFMAEALARGLPMICANPDLEVQRGTRHVLCAGALAQAYEARGGRVVYHGKPHAAAYAACFALFTGIAKGAVFAVGDSLLTDIAGANRAGIDGYLVASGIHGAELALADGEAPDGAKLAAACRARGVRPAAALARLIW